MQRVNSARIHGICREHLTTSNKMSLATSSSITKVAADPEFSRKELKTTLALVGDPEQLRLKLNNAKGNLAKYWKNFLELAAEGDRGEFAALPPLAWLVTGEERFARATRNVFLRLLDQLPQAAESVEAQLHAYTVGAPLARFSIYLDWIWDAGILEDRERDALASELVAQVYSSCYCRLKGRRPSSDNQQTSMAYACAATGYIFGVKRGCSPAARRMGEHGFQRFKSVATKIYDGGWCGEGSTYHHQVYSPILALYTSLVEEITGTDFFNARYAGGSIRDALLISALTINEAGMLPGWDQYGNCAPELKTHLAFLAKRAGIFWPLQLIERHQMWSENEILAWFNDDKVWTLLFWPDSESLSDTPVPDCWLNRPVAGRLVSPARSLDLLQMWDVVEGGRPGRAHMNPNNVEICAHGALVTSDGSSKEADPDYFDFPDGLSHAAAHSLVLVDGKAYSYPAEAWHGNGDLFCDLPTLKLVTGDVSDLYASLWDVEIMKRTSCLLGERVLLIADRFFSAGEHEYTWQMMLRPEVLAEGCAARQELREGVRVDYAAPPQTRFSVRPIKGYPRGLEERTDRLSFSKTLAGPGTFEVAVRAQPLLRVVADLSNGWRTSAGLKRPADLFEKEDLISLEGEFLGGEVRDGLLWFGSIVDLRSEDAQDAQRLSIKRAQVDCLEVWINGCKATSLFEEPSIDPSCRDVLKSEGRFWPTHFDVRGLFQAGKNEVLLVSSVFRGQSLCGPIHLLTEKEIAEEHFSIASDNGILTIQDGNTEWVVSLGNEERVFRDLGNGVQTDAIAVVVGDALLAMAQCTRCVGEKFSFSSSCVVDVELGKRVLEVVGPAHGDFEILLQLDDREYRISPEGWRGASCDAYKLKVRRSQELWSKSVETQPFPEDQPAFPPSLVGKSGIDCPFDPFLCEDALQMQALIVENLNHPDWKRRLGAVELAAIHGLRGTIPRLLELLEEEEEADIRMEGLGNWPFAKMKTAFHGWTTGRMLETTKRGHRLKTILVEALGKLQATEAIPTLGKILERKTDFYPTLHQACIAAGRLHATELLPFLDQLVDFPEVNVRRTSREVAQELRKNHQANQTDSETEPLAAAVS